ncbi:MAG: hypothetical protein GY762_11715 [Proteobacteria bacterium]|nr:hypothetical protein [Pseudomonadota bacterium]
MLISRNLVDLIEKNADALTKKWLNDVNGDPNLPTYRRYDDGELYERAFTVYSHLGKWLSTDTTRKDIEKTYRALGAQRQREGFKLHEVIQALITVRRVLWLKVAADGLLDTALDLKSAMELNSRVIVFFDRAIFYAAQGYEQTTS